MICSYDNDEDYDDDDEIDYGDDEDQNYYDYDDNAGLEGRAGVGREPARGDVYHYPCHCLCTQVFSKVSCNILLCLQTFPIFFFFLRALCHRPSLMFLSWVQLSSVIVDIIIFTISIIITKMAKISMILSGVLLIGVLIGAALLGHRRSSSRARARKLARLNGVKVREAINKNEVTFL